MDTTVAASVACAGGGAAASVSFCRRSSINQLQWHLMLTLIGNVIIVIVALFFCFGFFVVSVEPLDAAHLPAPHT